MQLISPETTKRGDTGNSHTSRRRASSLMRYSPSSAGSSAADSSSRHAGCVKSPVPTSEMPLRLAHKSRFGMSAFRPVALEYLE